MNTTILAHFLRAIAWLLFALFLLGLTALLLGTGFGWITLILACGAALQGMVVVWSTTKNA
ncbi:MAG TPA: hypothetical protein VGD58_11785 [Herpetosiphonaceae bacterium]